MPKQKYRLQALLVIKERQRKRAEIALAIAINELKKAKEDLKKLEEQKKKIIEKWKEARREMKSKMNSGACVGEGNVHVNYLRKLKEDEEKKQTEIEEQKVYIAECESNVAKARRDYIDASKELKIMQKHKELWEKKIRDEITRKEEKEMDELSSTIHQLRKWRGDKPIFEN